MTSLVASLTVAIGLWLVIPPPGSQGRVGELTAQLSASDPAVRATAACGLRELGDGAAPAIDALVALLSDAAPLPQPICGRNWWRGHPNSLTSPGEQAAAALVAIGGRAVAPLLAALDNPVWTARRHAAWALGALDNRRATPALVRALRDAEPGVREQAAWALGALNDPAGVPAILDGLKDRDPRVRQQSAWAAGALNDERAVDPLLRLLTDGEAGVREQVCWALGAIGEERALHPLLPHLKDPDARVRRQAAWAIGVLNR